MNAIDEIKTRLHKYPDVRYEITGKRATIFPSSENGFAVSLTDDAPQYTVSFDAWHEEYEDMGIALNAFAFGLSDDCRLKVGYRGNFAYVWIVEEVDEDGNWSPCQWIGCNETGLLISPFWLKKRFAYLQNDLLKNGKRGT